jgi:hypothetical protein
MCPPNRAHLTESPPAASINPISTAVVDPGLDASAPPPHTDPSTHPPTRPFRRPLAHLPPAWPSPQRPPSCSASGGPSQSCWDASPDPHLRLPPRRTAPPSCRCRAGRPRTRPRTARPPPGRRARWRPEPPRGWRVRGRMRRGGSRLGRGRGIARRWWAGWTALRGRMQEVVGWAGWGGTPTIPHPTSHGTRRPNCRLQANCTPTARQLHAIIPRLPLRGFCNRGGKGGEREGSGGGGAEGRG